MISADKPDKFFMAKKLNWVFLAVFLVSFTALALSEGPFGPVTAVNDISYFLPPDLLINDSWYGIYSGGRYLGYSHFLMKAEESGRDKGYQIKTKTIMDIPAMSFSQSMNLDTEVNLDRRYAVEDATLKLVIPGYFVHGELTKADNGEFSLVIKTPSQAVTRRFKPPAGVMSFSFAPMMFNYLPAKKEARFLFYDPLLEKKTKITVRRSGKEKMLYEGKQHDVIKFAFDIEGAEGAIYTDKKGYVLKQEFLGFEFVEEDPVILFEKKASHGGVSAANESLGKAGSSAQ